MLMWQVSGCCDIKVAQKLWQVNVKIIFSFRMCVFLVKKGKWLENFAFNSFPVCAGKSADSGIRFAEQNSLFYSPASEDYVTLIR